MRGLVGPAGDCTNAEAFRQAGPRASFNRGNAVVLAGRYKEAVAAYDAVIYRNPDDREAHFNRTLVASVVNSVIGEARPGGGLAPTQTRTPVLAALRNQSHRSPSLCGTRTSRS